MVDATFTDTELTNLYIEYSEREIYNDIRSKTDITEQTETSAEGTSEERSTNVVFGTKSNVVYGYNDLLVYSTSGHTDVHWESAGIISTDYPPALEYLSAEIIAYSNFFCKVRITDLLTGHPEYIQVTVSVTYTYFVQEIIVENRVVETNTRTLTVRSTDDTSIGKYGRRVMNLVWPLGQTEEQMQSIVDAYCAKYKDPVVTARMMMTGDTDAKVAQIMARDVSDYVTLQCTAIELDDEFWINSVDVQHRVDGIITATYDLEQARTEEEYTMFTINTSSIDGTAYIGW